MNETAERKYPKENKLIRFASLAILIGLGYGSCNYYRNATLEGTVINKSVKQVQIVYNQEPKWEYHSLTLRLDNGKLVERSYEEHWPFAKVRYAFDKIEVGDRARVRRFGSRYGNIGSAKYPQKVEEKNGY